MHMTTTNWVSVCKGIVYVGLFALLLTPFIVTNSLYFPYITGKAFFFRVIVEIIFGAWLILAIVEPQYRLKRSPIITTFSIFLITLCISNILGTDPISSFWSNFERMEGYVTIVHLFLLVCVLGSVMRDERMWNIYIHASVITSMGMVLQAINQIRLESFSFRLDTTLGNPIYLAVYMLFNSFFSLWLIARLSKPTLQAYVSSVRFWLYGLIWVSQILIVFQTQTRGAMLGIFGGLCVTFLLTLLFAKNERPMRIASGVFLGIAALCAVGIYVGRDTHFVQSIPALERLTTISATQGTGQARLWNWGIAWRGVQEHPLFGWGQSNYNFVFDTYYDPRMFGQETWFDRTHNIVLDWLIAGGWIGFLAYASIIVSVLYLVWRRMSVSVFEKSIITGTLVAYGIHNMFVFDQIVSYLLFMIVVGYVYNQTTYTADSSSSIDLQYKGYIMTAVFIVMCGTVYQLNYPAYATARTTVEAIQLFRTEGGRMVYAYQDGLNHNISLFKEALQGPSFAAPEIRTRIATAAGDIFRVSNLPENVKVDFLQFAESEMIQQIQDVPKDSRYPYLLAMLYGQVGIFDKASIYLEKAFELSPQKQIFHFLLARMYLVQGNKDAALQRITTAYNLAPEVPDAWNQYVNLLGLIDKPKFDAEIESQLQQGNYEKVEYALKENLERYPDSINSYVSLSALYVHLNNTARALEVLNDAIVKFPTMQNQLKKIYQQIETGNNPLGKNF